MLNNYNQSYDILGRFFISGAEYCRVRFTSTKHEQIVLAEQIKAGNFEDKSIAIKPTNVKPKVIKPEAKEAIEALNKMSYEDNIESIKSTPLETPQPEPFNIIATNPKGEEITIDSLELEEFCSDHKLDYEAVQAILEGKQKSHRKWRFIKDDETN